MRPTVAFILSLQRSGSTWLNLVLGSHSWAANVGEYRRIFTIPGHVVCRLCEADGLSECRLLHGAADVPAEAAYHFAAERLGRDVIVDASKRLDWCARFLERPDLDVRLIHLVRHPCGFVASQGRREPGKSPDDLFREWASGNRAIAEFAGSSGLAHTMCSYDDLADHPETTFPALCRFLGHAYEPGALRYWKFAHHGLGGNGAASLYLRGRRVRNFDTGDDAYYEELLDEDVRSDRRWMGELDRATCARFLDDPYTRYLRAQLPAGLEWLRPDRAADE